MPTFRGEEVKGYERDWDMSREAGAKKSPGCVMFRLSQRKKIKKITRKPSHRQWCR